MQQKRASSNLIAVTNLPVLIISKMDTWGSSINGTRSDSVAFSLIKLIIALGEICETCDLKFALLITDKVTRENASINLIELVECARIDEAFKHVTTAERWSKSHISKTTYHTRSNTNRSRSKVYWMLVKKVNERAERNESDLAPEKTTKKTNSRFIHVRHETRARKKQRN